MAFLPSVSAYMETLGGSLCTCHVIDHVWSREARPMVVYLPW